MPDQLLLAGHTLVREGGAFHFTACPDCAAAKGAHRSGHAKCSCGEVSQHLPSTAQRKQWHREHKHTVATQRSGANHVCPSDGQQTGRAKRVEELVTVLGRARSNKNRSRTDYEALADHLMHMRMHRLCCACGYPLDNSAPHPAAQPEAVAQNWATIFKGSKKVTHKSLAVTG